MSRNRKTVLIGSKYRPMLDELEGEAIRKTCKNGDFTALWPQDEPYKGVEGVQTVEKR